MGYLRNILRRNLVVHYSASVTQLEWLYLAVVRLEQLDLAAYSPFLTFFRLSFSMAGSPGTCCSYHVKRCKRHLMCNRADLCDATPLLLSLLIPEVVRHTCSRDTYEFRT